MDASTLYIVHTCHDYLGSHGWIIYACSYIVFGLSARFMFSVYQEHLCIRYVHEMWSSDIGNFQCIVLVMDTTSAVLFPCSDVLLFFFCEDLLFSFDWPQPCTVQNY
jgi:hypothetical protein